LRLLDKIKMVTDSIGITVTNYGDSLLNTLNSAAACAPLNRKPDARAPLIR